MEDKHLLKSSHSAQQSHQQCHHVLHYRVVPCTFTSLQCAPEQFYSLKLLHLYIVTSLAWYSFTLLQLYRHTDVG